MSKWPLFCVILPNLVVSGVHCVKVVDKAITMDNLQLLCLVMNNNNNNNNPICKAPECQKTSVALADRNSRAN